MIFNNNWMFLAFLAATCWGVVNVLDKAFLENHLIKISTRQFLDSGCGLLVAALLLFKLSTPTFPLVILGILGGALVFLFNYLYYHALKQADVSAISVYLQSTPVFSAIIGFIFLAERFHLYEYLGALLIIIGAILVAIERTSRGVFTIFSGKNMEILLKYIIPASFIMSINYGLTKLLLGQHSFWEVFFWGRIGFVITGLVIYLSRRRLREEVNSDIIQMSARTIYRVIVIEALNFFGILLLTAACAFGTITLVSTVLALQPLIVVIVLVLIGILSNQVLKDFSSSKRVLIVRLFAIMLQVIGMVMLSKTLG